MHPWSGDPVKTGYGVARGFPVDLALGSFEYLELHTSAGHFTGTAPIWHRALNCGFRITASAGEDSILGLHSDADHRVEPPVCIRRRQAGMAALCRCHPHRAARL